MFATLLAVVVALAIGHMAQSLALSLRQFHWFAHWLQWLDARFPEDGFWRGHWGIVLALLPPLLVVGLFQFALREAVYGLPGLLLGVVVLFYCWGLRDLDLDVDAITEAGSIGERSEAAAHLWPVGGQVSLQAAALVAAVFGNAKRRWFGVLFWFLLLGPVGALLYRLAALAAEGEASSALPPDTVSGARNLLAALDWPVAQLMTLSLALVGNFDTVFGAWKEAGGAGFDIDADFLAAAARASVRGELAEEAEDLVDETESGVATATAVATGTPEMPELRDAMSLVWRMLLVWLAVLALFVIAGWVS